jgi:hypothetical protein
MNRSRPSLSPMPQGRLTSTCSISGESSPMWSALPSSMPAHSVPFGNHAFGDAVNEVDGRADRAGRGPKARKSKAGLG